jgi:hypothetical protein
MSVTLRSILILGMGGMALFCGNSHSREIEDWPDDKLLKHADLVVIVKALHVREAKKEDRATPPGASGTYLTGVVTTFNVVHVVKGKQEKKKLDFIHFRLKDGVRISNGPLLAAFHTDKLDRNGVRCVEYYYKLFLKKDKDGRLTFVSGQCDSELSVKRVKPPLWK